MHPHETTIIGWRSQLDSYANSEAGDWLPSVEKIIRTTLEGAEIVFVFPWKVHFAFSVNRAFARTIELKKASGS